MAPRAHDIRANDGIVVRTPLLPVDVLVDWPIQADIAAQRRYLGDVIARPDVNEAIFVASPGLHGSIEKWRLAPDSEAGQRAEHALVKYVARMSWRSTPFGLFAAVSSGRLGRETVFELAPRGEYRRRTRLDNDYLFLLAAELARVPAVREALRWRPNTSIYRLGGRLRYAEARLEGKARTYHLVSVEPTPYLDATLDRAAGGARPDALARALVADDPEVALEDARSFIAELMDQQLLVSDLGVHVTGPEPVDGMIDELAAAGAGEAGAALSAAREAIGALDAGGLGNDPARYRAIAAGLEVLPVKVDLAQLFQVDMVKPARATVAARVASDVLRTVSALAAVWPRPEAAALDDWKRAFTERWEGREIPLAEALDEESGIGFESASGPGVEGGPLLAGLAFPPALPPARVAWTGAEVHLLRRLTAALEAGHDEIDLDEADLAAMVAGRPPRLPGRPDLPDAFAALVRLGRSPDGQPQVLLESASGPSGARLLGRFCHASAEVRHMVDVHHRLEEALRPDAILAEIVHLNEGRIGNVLCRPVLREYEIVFLGISGAPEDRQIMIDDLVVAVGGGRIVLRSRRLGREVIPRLSTAHNYRLRSLAVYRFLCALAAQDGEVGSFSWDPLASASFLPRVRMGTVILSRATWNFDERDLEPITSAVRNASRFGAAGDGQPGGRGGDPGRRAEIALAITALRRARRLPRFVALVDADHELPVDFDNPLLVAALADELAGRRSARITELFPAPDGVIAVAEDGRYTNEVLLTFTRTRHAGRATARDGRPPEIRRAFPPGSEWLYAKVYCGTSTTDRVLRDAIGPVVRQALASGDVSRWFFVRHADPDNHLRVRFAGDPARLIRALIPALESALAPLLAAGAVQRWQLDTYTRELERYGGDAGMELIEHLFWIDSDAVLAIIDQLDGDAGHDARWRLALRGIDGLLEGLGLDPEVRARTALTARDSLAVEHRATAELWSKLGERFAHERADLEVLWARDAARDGPGHPLESGIEILARRDARIADIATELRGLDEAAALSPRLEEMAWSLAHMHANRLLQGSQRTQEMVLYDFLRRLHAARRARAGRGAGLDRPAVSSSGGGR